MQAPRAAPVLCAVDDSPAGLAAARLSGAVAERLDAPLTLVHCAPVGLPSVAGLPPTDDLIDAALREQRAIALSAATDVLQRVAADLSAPAPRLVACAGATLEGILETALDEEPALLAIGTRGRGPLAAGVLGSVSAGLVERADRPVLVVPDAVARRPAAPSRILAAIPSDDDGCVVVAAWLADALGARLTLAHVVPPVLARTAHGLVGPPIAVGPDPVGPRSGAPSLERALARLDDPTAVETRELEGDPAPVLLALADELGTDVIVTGTRRQSHLRAALLGSVSRTLIAAGVRPVLVVPGSVCDGHDDAQRRSRAPAAAAVPPGKPTTRTTASRRSS